jgi:hypothetical protein
MPTTMRLDPDAEALLMDLVVLDEVAVEPWLYAFTVLSTRDGDVVIWRPGMDRSRVTTTRMLERIHAVGFLTWLALGRVLATFGVTRSAVDHVQQVSLAAGTGARYGSAVVTWQNLTGPDASRKEQYPTASRAQSSTCRHSFE